MIQFDFIDPYPTPEYSAGEEADSDGEEADSDSDFDFDFDFDSAFLNIVPQKSLDGLRQLAGATLALQEKTWGLGSKWVIPNSFLKVC